MRAWARRRHVGHGPPGHAHAFGVVAASPRRAVPGPFGGEALGDLGPLEPALEAVAAESRGHRPPVRQGNPMALFSASRPPTWGAGALRVSHLAPVSEAPLREKPALLEACRAKARPLLAGRRALARVAGSPMSRRLGWVGRRGAAARHVRGDGVARGTGARSGDAPLGERLPQRPLFGPRVERGGRRLAAQERRFLARFRTPRHDVAARRVGDVGGHGRARLVSRLRPREPDRRAVPAYAAARQGDDVRRADAHPRPQPRRRLVAQGHATAVREDAPGLVPLARGGRHDRRLPRRRRVRQGEEQVGVRQLAPASEPLEELAYTRVERVLALGGRVRIPRVEELDVLGRDVGEVRDADAVDEHAEAANTRPEHVERRPLPALRPLHREERADLGRAPSRQPVEERFPGDDGPAEIVRDALVALLQEYHGPAAAREVAAR